MGASEAEHKAFTRPSSGSLTTTLVRVTLPSLVTSMVYMMVSPAAKVPPGPVPMLSTVLLTDISGLGVTSGAEAEPCSGPA